MVKLEIYAEYEQMLEWPVIGYVFKDHAWTTFSFLPVNSKVTLGFVTTGSKSIQFSSAQSS